MDRVGGSIDVLRSAVAADARPEHRAAHAATLALLERAERVGPDRIAGWERFSEVAAGILGEKDGALTVGVMANLVSVVSLAEPGDFRALAELTRQHGHQPVAAVQTTVDDLLRTGPGMPLASRFTWRGVLSQRIVDSLVASGADHDDAVDVARRSYRSSYWLVMADVDESRPGPELTTVEDAVRCADHGGILAWRSQIAIVAHNPWATYPAELAALLRQGDRPAPADALESAVKHYRDVSERRDRQLVAREIRRLVAVSGLSQREFAALCGTSAPRLSTYVNGLVTPSAAMMVRFTRISDLARQEIRRGNGSTA